MERAGGYGNGLRNDYPAPILFMPVAIAMMTEVRPRSGPEARLRWSKGGRAWSCSNNDRRHAPLLLCGPNPLHQRHRYLYNNMLVYLRGRKHLLFDHRILIHKMSICRHLKQRPAIRPRRKPQFNHSRPHPPLRSELKSSREDHEHHIDTETTRAGTTQDQLPLQDHSAPAQARRGG